MVNWLPLRNVKGTIFEDLSDEKPLAEIDFTDFEDKFKAKVSHSDSSCIIPSHPNSSQLIPSHPIDLFVVLTRS
jgi:hypothetical protein